MGCINKYTLFFVVVAEEERVDYSVERRVLTRFSFVLKTPGLQVEIFSLVFMLNLSVNVIHTRISISDSLDYLGNLVHFKT